MRSTYLRLSLIPGTSLSQLVGFSSWVSSPLSNTTSRWTPGDLDNLIEAPCTLSRLILTCHSRPQFLLHWHSWGSWRRTATNPACTATHLRALPPCPFPRMACPGSPTAVAVPVPLASSRAPFQECPFLQHIRPSPSCWRLPLCKHAAVLLILEQYPVPLPLSFHDTILFPVIYHCVCLLYLSCPLTSRDTP